MVLLTAVLLAVVVVAAVRGRVVAGEPVAEPIGAPPQVGDCAVENPLDLGAALNNWADTPPTVGTSVCAGERFGEVAHVYPDGSSAGSVATTSAGDLYGACGSHVDGYLSAPAPPSGSQFVPHGRVPFALIGPDARQRAAGQRWAACLIFLPISTDPDVPITVDHSLRDAWLDDVDNHLFAYCTDDETTGLPANCRSIHRFEVLAVARGTPGESQETMDAACRTAVAVELGSAAALDGGFLSSVAIASSPIRRMGSRGPGPRPSPRTATTSSHAWPPRPTARGG
ncbi:MAG TPA: septum formation family protein [Nakamurella sp.]